MSRQPVPARTGAGRNAPLMAVLRVLIAAGLVTTAVIHWQLAPGFQQAAPDGVGGGTLFRAQAVASVVAAGYVLVRGTRPAYLIAAVVALSSLAAALITRYVDIPAIGPIPSLYEPVWYTTKTISALAEGITGALAVTGYLLLTRARNRTGRRDLDNISAS